MKERKKDILLEKKKIKIFGVMFNDIQVIFMILPCDSKEILES